MSDLKVEMVVVEGSEVGVSGTIHGHASVIRCSLVVLLLKIDFPSIDTSVAFAESHSGWLSPLKPTFELDCHNIIHAYMQTWRRAQPLKSLDRYQPVSSRHVVSFLESLALPE